MPTWKVALLESAQLRPLEEYVIKKSIKAGIKKLFAQFGLDIRRAEGPSIKTDPFYAMQEIIGRDSSPMIFDVGGNVGQSVRKFRDRFKVATIHSFEPASNVFPQLEENCKDDSRVFCWQSALGSARGELEMHLNERPVFNSIRTARNYIRDKVYAMENVPVLTVDQFCEEHGIDFIDILKTDTEGFDSEVFRGAARMFRENRVGLIYFECFFKPVYADVEPFHETYRFLTENGFSVVNFYSPRIKDFMLKLNDTLFINDEYAGRLLDRR